MATKSYVQRSFNVSELLSAMYLGKPHIPKANSLLNTLWNVNPNERPAEGEYPSLALYGIGRGAHQLVSKEIGGSAPLKTPIYATDNGMELPMPFVVRELSNDLTPAERQKYAMREVRDIDGVLHAIYWLRWLNLDNVSQVTELQVVEDGEVISSKPYNPTPESLQPSPRNYDDASLKTSRKRCISYFNIPVAFNENDTMELINACTILYNDPTAAVVSEIMLASGIRRELPTPEESGTSMMTEVVAAQMNAHASTYQVLYSSSKGFAIDILSGAGEPITVPESVE